MDNYSGLYSPNNGAHFYPNNGSYGAWRVAGSRNGWYGLEFDTAAGQTSFMVGTTGQGRGSQMTGFHNNSYGWLWRFDHSTLAVGSVPLARIPDIGSASVNYANSAGNADTVDGKHASQLEHSMDIFSLTHAQTYTTSWGHNGDTIYAYLTVRKDGTWTISRNVWCGHSNIWWGAASADNVEELCGLGKITSIDPYSGHCIRVWVHPNTHGYLGIFGDSTNLANVYVSQ